MQSDEIRPCDICTKGLCLDGHTSFLRVRFERFKIDPKLRHSTQTREAMFAGDDPQMPDLMDRSAKAPEAAELFEEPADLIVCETCATIPGDTLATLGQLAQVSLSERKAAAEAINNGDHHDCENQN